MSSLRLVLAYVSPCFVSLGICAAQSAVVLEANRGQASPEVEFVARTAEGTVLLTGASAVLLHGVAAQKMEFLGASPDLCVDPGLELASRSHYFRGNDPARWISGVPHFGAVRFSGLYPGVDLTWRGAAGRLEYDLELAPGADLGAVAFQLSGFDVAWIGDEGALHVLSGERETVHGRPLAWQVEPDGAQRAVECGFALGGDTVRFEVAAYDPALPLVIDPVLVFSTYLGGAAIDWTGGLAVDASENVIVAGYTASTDFPLLGGFQAAVAGMRDAYVTKLSADGSTLLWSAVLGGSNMDICEPHSLVLDSMGRPCITGSTSSADFPTTPGCLQPAFGGNNDAYLAVLAADGSALVYSTFLGGPNFDGPRSIAVRPPSQANAAEQLVVTGAARAGFPTTLGAYSTTLAGDADIFVAVVDPAVVGAAGLVYSTYLGGSLFERGDDVAVDSLGRIHVAATATTQKTSVLLPTTPTAFRPTVTFAKNDTSTQYVGYYAVLTTAATGPSDLTYATFVNSRQAYALTAYALAIDGLDRAFITGLASGATIPTTANAFDATFNGGSYDLYLLVVDPALSGGASLRYGSYLGSSLAEMTGDIALDASGRACVVGFSNSNVAPPGNTKNIPYPTTANAIRRTSAGSWDGVLTVLDVTLSPSQQLVYSTLYGGPAEDHFHQVALGTGGRCYLSGIVAPGTGGFPTTPGAFDTSYNGDADGVLVRIDL